MDEREMQAYLFEIDELIDEVSKYESDLDFTINQIIEIYEKSNDLNDTLLKVKLNHLKKIWKERKQFDKLRIKLNTIHDD